MRLSQARILAIVCLVCFHHFILYMYRCSERCLFTLLLHTIYTGANCSLPSGVVFYRSLKTIGWPWVAVFISGRRVVSWMCSPFPLFILFNLYASFIYKNANSSFKEGTIKMWNNFLWILEILAKIANEQLKNWCQKYVVLKVKANVAINKAKKNPLLKSKHSKCGNVNIVITCMEICMCVKEWSLSKHDLILHNMIKPWWYKNP